SRQLAIEYQQQVDWSPLAELTDVQQIANQAAQQLEQEAFTTTTAYDALNRPIALTTPDGSVTQPTYNEANLLERVDVNLRGGQTTTEFVTNLDYNAKGQRELIEYSIKDSNNVTGAVQTAYTYDPLTFRLTNIKTTRTTDNKLLQDLHYTYDPVGNITQLQDDAQQIVFFRNAQVEPLWQHAYDAVYRLIQAAGREHAGQTDYQPAVLRANYRDYPFLNGANPNDPQALRNYTEQYDYDPVGNILRLTHQAAAGNWTRRYDYETNNLDVQTQIPLNNRLQSTSLPGDADQAPYSAKYQYDAHGNMTKLPHLAQMDWDFKDQLHMVDLGGGGKAYYVYDAAGQRTRKVVEKNNGALIEERIYLGGYEIFRRRNGNGDLTLERETLHIMDDKRRIALVETKTLDANALPNTLPITLTRYQLDNHLGSAALELDASGAVISYEEYCPYGTTSYQAVRNDVEVSPKRYRYTGKERD